METEHLLLGLLREDKNLANRFLRDLSSIEDIREEIEGRTTIREKVSTSIDLPLSKECKRILAYSAEEAELLTHRHIGTEHLLLGILREERCVAAEILHERGLRLDAIREELSRSATNDYSMERTPRPKVTSEEIMVPNAITALHIAVAVWIPAYGAQTVANTPPPDATLVPFKTWRVTAGPFFAFIRMEDGRVLAMGKTEETHV
jgi:ATP-dependent Clp protease ATP-binding subunit ClpA